MNNYSKPMQNFMCLNGWEIVVSVCYMVVCCTGVSVESPVLEDMYEYVYTEFMEEIDAVDNGISDRDGEPR